jgi:hypothetical protein
VPVWDQGVVAAVGAALGAVTAYVQQALSARAKAGEELRERRLAAYPVIWRESAPISLYPSAVLTWADLTEVHLAFRRWYYTTGGILLSERSRDRYGDVQNLLGAYLASVDDERDVVDAPAQEAISQTGSAFRTALTEDLATRRQRSPVWALKSRLWHRKQKRKARKRVDKAGDKTLQLPLEALALPPPTLSQDAVEGAES